MANRRIFDRAVAMTLERLPPDDMKLSEKSSFSGSGDISELIASFDETQVLQESGSTGTAPSVASSSTISSMSSLSRTTSASASSVALSSFHLGKRKSSSLSNILDVHPNKFQRTFAASLDDDDNPFLLPGPPALSSVQPDTPVIIAHSENHQPGFDKRGLSHGVQYEIARLVSCGVLKYENISVPDLDRLKGPNVLAAPKTAEVLKLHSPDEGTVVHAMAFAKELAAKSPWEELDTEEARLKADPFSGLGFSKDNPDWYGGKVHFRGKLVEQNRGGYKIVLERVELGPSCRFARRFGSTSILRIKVPPSVFKVEKESGLIAFFSRPFILNGGVFRSFFAKDENVFLFRTNEEFRGSQVCAPPAGSPGMSLFDFLNWHNPLKHNQNQTLTKWASRFSLGLSTSVPGVKVAVQDILHEDDVVSSIGEDMTDGCGFINKLPLRLMQTRFDWPEFPTVIQCRVAGSKGLLMRPDARDDGAVVPITRIRPSQVKIRYPPDSPADPAMLIVDLLISSRLKTPVRLSHEVLINLAENGVPCEVFGQLFMSGLAELVEGLMTWDDPAELWRMVSQKGGVMFARRGREAGTESRARGYGERDNEEVELEDEDGLQAMENALKVKSSAWWWDEVSGSPSSLEETVMVLLDAGFMPQTCAVLREKLRMVVLTSIETYSRKVKVEVPMSCTAFIVPDPFGVLGPREVHIKSSRRNLKSPDGPETDLVLGDVLLTRNPCKLPTDVQKFQAVEKPELRHLTDVIVCSVKGDRRQADLLAGGDYDGDRAQAIWQPEIVGCFVDPDLKHSHKPNSVDESFESDNGKVGEFLDQMAKEPESKIVSALQGVLLGAIRDTAVVGKYSTYHENAIYSLGHDHEQTMELAWKFCVVLDGTKSGLRVKPEVLKSDGRKWSRTLGPVWKDKVDEKKKVDKRGLEDNKTYLKRPRKMRRFVMDEITELAREKGQLQLSEVKKTFLAMESTVHKDDDLTGPWERAVEMAKRFVDEEGNDRMQRDLEVIADHVRKVYSKHRAQLRLPLSPRKENKGAAFTELPIEVRQDKIRALSQEFVSRPGADEVLMEEGELRRLRASYAYYYDVTEGHKWTRFPFDVGMRELCAIKARAIGPSKTVTSTFYDRFFLR